MEQAAKRARERLTRAAELLVDGTIDKPGYELLRDKAQAELDAAEGELIRLRGARRDVPALPDIDALLSLAGGWSEMLAASDVVGQREVLAPLVSRVAAERIVHGRYEARIEWTPLGEALRSLSAALSIAA